MEVGQTNGFDIVGLIVVVMAAGALLLILLGLGFFLQKFVVGWIKHRNREKVSLQFVVLRVKVARDNETKIDAVKLKLMRQNNFLLPLPRLGNQEAFYPFLKASRIYLLR